MAAQLAVPPFPFIRYVNAPAVAPMPAQGVNPAVAAIPEGLQFPRLDNLNNQNGIIVVPHRAPISFDGDLPAAQRPVDTLIFFGSWNGNRLALPDPTIPVQAPYFHVIQPAAGGYRRQRQRKQRQQRATRRQQRRQQQRSRFRSRKN